MKSTILDPRASVTETGVYIELDESGAATGAGLWREVGERMPSLPDSSRWMLVELSEEVILKLFISSGWRQAGSATNHNAILSARPQPRARLVCGLARQWSSLNAIVSTAAAPIGSMDGAATEHVGELLLQTRQDRECVAL